MAPILTVADVKARLTADGQNLTYAAARVVAAAQWGRLG